MNVARHRDSNDSLLQLCEKSQLEGRTIKSTSTVAILPLRKRFLITGLENELEELRDLPMRLFRVFLQSNRDVKYVHNAFGTVILLEVLLGSS